MIKQGIQIAGLLLVIALSGGCATRGFFESTMDTWLGGEFDRFAAAYGDPLSTERIAENLTAHQYMLPGFRDCRVTWYVDEEGIIVDRYYEGRSCRMAPSL